MKIQSQFEIDYHLNPLENITHVSSFVRIINANWEEFNFNAMYYQWYALHVFHSIFIHYPFLCVCVCVPSECHNSFAFIHPFQFFSHCFFFCSFLIIQSYDSLGIGTGKYILYMCILYIYIYLVAWNDHELCSKLSIKGGNFIYKFRLYIHCDCVISECIM